MNDSNVVSEAEKLKYVNTSEKKTLLQNRVMLTQLEYIDQ